MLIKFSLFILISLIPVHFVCGDISGEEVLFNWDDNRTELLLPTKKKSARIAILISRS